MCEIISAPKFFFVFLFLLSFLAQADLARIDLITSSKEFRAITDCEKIQSSDRVAIISQDDQSSLGYASIERIEKSRTGMIKNVYLRIIRHLNTGLIRLGDYVKVCETEDWAKQLAGSAELLDRDPKRPARFQFLAYQGLLIGPTAETLSKNEFLLEMLGDFYYGVTDEYTLQTQLVGDALGTPNLQLKYKAFEGERNVVSFSGAVNYYNRLDQYSAFVYFYWDNVNSANQITHTVLSLKTPLGEDDSKSFKIFSSSTLQSGYEFVLSDWDRVLFGPRYYFSLQSVGGYLGYMWIWDSYHFTLNLNTIDIANFTLDGNRGYFMAFDMFWRF